MLAVRVIPCLDVAAGRVVKGVNFVNLADAGDLWPSDPILFRELPVPVAPSAAAGDAP